MVLIVQLMICLLAVSSLPIFFVHIVCMGPLLLSDHSPVGIGFKLQSLSSSKGTLNLGSRDGNVNGDMNL